MILKRILNRLATNARNIALLGKYMMGKKVSKIWRGRVVFLDMPEPRLERYYYLLAKYFDLAGWRVIIKFSPNLLLNLRNCSDRIYNLENMKIVLVRPKLYDLHLCLGVSNFAERRIQIDVDYFGNDKNKDGYVWPFPMYADVYDKGIANRASEMRHCERSIRIFFGGNTGLSYDRPEMKAIFGKINRNRLADIVETVLDGEKAIGVNSKTHLETLIENGRVSLIWLRKEVHLDTQDWMRAMASADFFIAAPGNNMPFSHNAVEAMAVGTIPILEYAEMFTPPLTHGVNCVVFNGEADFLEKIAWCGNLSANQVANLRKGVVEYYDRFIEPTAVVARFFDRAGSISKMYINAEHLSLMKVRAADATIAKNDNPNQHKRRE